MSSVPLFSIIIPCYNDGEYAIEAINSCLAQNYTSLEVIFVDDGSINGSYEKVSNYYINNLQVKCFRKNNGGSSSARNFGIEKATGQYIVFLDSDDLIQPGYIRLAHASLKEKDSLKEKLSIVMPFRYFAAKQSRRSNQAIRYKPPILGNVTLVNLLKLALMNCFPISSIVLPRSIIEQGLRFDEKLDYYEDWDFWIRVAKSGATFGYADFNPDAATLIRIREGMSSNLAKMRVNRGPVFKKNFSGTIYMLFQIPVIGGIVRKSLLLCWNLFYTLKSHPNLTSSGSVIDRQL